MVKDLVSIVVPVYNVEKYIRQCLDSIINQTYKTLEILVVDDGSTDKSGFICDKYAVIDSRVKVYHKDNGGLSDARNFGRKHAAGEYIYFVDSDDYLELDIIEYCVALAVKENADIIDCNAWKILEKKKTKTQMFPTADGIDNGIDMLRWLINEETYRVTAWNKLYKSFLFDSVE